MESFPCIKATMGNWDYYIVKMSMYEAAKIRYSSELGRIEHSLDDAIQRELNTSRAKKSIMEYLYNRDDRFFSSLVVASFGGNPEFWPLKIAIDDTSKFFADDLEDETFGVLKFNSKQKYYALDGQHRLAAIRAVLDPDGPTPPEGFRDETISVLMIVRRDEEDEIYIPKFRSLFSSLNRWAKPTDKDTNIIMDEDDLIAILTRRLIREHPFFMSKGPDKESFRVQTKGKPLSRGSSCFTSLQTLYAIVENLLDSKWRRNENVFSGIGTPTPAFKMSRPDTDQIDSYYEEIELYLECILEALPFLSNHPGVMRIHNPKNNQEDSEDNVLFWPIGQELLSKICRQILDSKLEPEFVKNPSKEKILKELFPLNKIDWELHNSPWRYFLLDNSPRKDSTDEEEKTWRLSTFSGDRKGKGSIFIRLVKFMSGQQDVSDPGINDLMAEWKAESLGAMNDDDYDGDFESMWKTVVETRSRIINS